MKFSCKTKTKLTFLGVFILSFCFPELRAQDRVEVKSFAARLYKDYVNQINVVVFNSTDSADHYGYKLHALANGADLNYQQEDDYPAIKMFVLPHQASGYIHFYLEKQGRFYHANDSILFDAIKANPNDELFQQTMGITKENPGNKLASMKTFVLPQGVKVSNSDFELDGVDFYNGFHKRNKYIKVRVRSLFIKDINGVKQYVRQNSMANKFEFRSSDLKIRESGRNTFYIAPIKQNRGRYEVYLNNKKVTEGSFSILD